MVDFKTTLNLSLINLFNGFGDSRFDSRQTKVAPVYESQYEISCHMGFYAASGKSAGVALLNINRKDLIELWSRIWQVPPMEENAATDIAKELINMIVANASAEFARQGQVFRVALPHIIESGHTIKLSTMKRDNFYYTEISEGDIRFNWVVCSYDVIEFN